MATLASCKAMVTWLSSIMAHPHGIVTRMVILVPILLYSTPVVSLFITRMVILVPILLYSTP